jgi:hypothetical protein
VSFRHYARALFVFGQNIARAFTDAKDMTDLLRITRDAMTRDTLYRKVALLVESLCGRPIGLRMVEDPDAATVLVLVEGNMDWDDATLVQKTLKKELPAAVRLYVLPAGRDAAAVDAAFRLGGVKAAWELAQECNWWRGEEEERLEAKDGK